MFSFVLKRLLQVIPLLLIIMSLTFFVMRLAPGNPFANERQLSAEVQANLNRRFGLDRQIFYFSIFQYREEPRPDGTTEWVRHVAPRWNGIDNQYHNYFFWRDVPDPDTGEVRREWGVVGGNFGPSTRFTDARSVTDVIMAGLPLSISLGFMAYVIALILGIPIGILAAYRQNSSADYLSMAGAMIGISVPC
jgi:oligopeptide transport system permease protein